MRSHSDVEFKESRIDEVQRRNHEASYERDLDEFCYVGFALLALALIVRCEDHDGVEGE